MTTVTLTIDNDNDLHILQEIFDRFGLKYQVEEETGTPVSNEDLKNLLAARQEYIDGKTTARDWHDIQQELNSEFD